LEGTQQIDAYVAKVVREVKHAGEERKKEIESLYKRLDEEVRL